MSPQRPWTAMLSASLFSTACGGTEEVHTREHGDRPPDAGLGATGMDASTQPPLVEPEAMPSPTWGELDASVGSPAPEPDVVTSERDAAIVNPAPNNDAALQEPTTEPEPPADTPELRSCLSNPTPAVLNVDPETSARYQWSECARIEATGPPVEVLYAMDGSVLVLEENGRVVAYAPDSNRPQVLVDSQTTATPAVGFDLSHDGRTLVLQDSRLTVRLMRPATDEPIGLSSGLLVERGLVDLTSTLCHEAFAFSDERAVLVGQSSNALCVFDVNDGSILSEFSLESVFGYGEFTVGVTPGDAPIRVFGDGVLAQYTLEGELLASFPIPGLVDDSSYKPAPLLSSDAELLVVAIPGQAEEFGWYVTVFDTNTGLERWSLHVPGDPNDVRYVASTDGLLLVERVGVYRLEDGSQVHEAPRSSLEGAEALAPGGGKAIAIAGLPQPREWSVTEAKLLRLYGSHGERVRGLSSSQDGRFLASEGSGSLAWEVAVDLADSIPRYSGAAGYDVAISPDGSLMIVGGDVAGGDNALFYRSDGSRYFDQPAVSAGSRGCGSAGWVFSPNGCSAAGSFYDHNMVLDLEAFEWGPVLNGEVCNSGVAFTPDGARLLTATMDWFDAQTWQPLEHPSAPVSGAYHVEFSPDGAEYVATHNEQCSTSDVVGLTASVTPDCINRSERYAVESGELLEIVPWLVGGRPHYSPEGHWLLDAGRLYHATSGATLELSEDVTTSVFTKDGNVVAGTADGALVSFCRDADQ